MSGRRRKGDHECAARIRARRQELGITLEEMAGDAGVSYQQGQKYEKGTNRVSAGALVEIAQALRTDPNTLLGWKAPPVELGLPREMLEMAKLYRAIPSRAERDALRNVARVMANGRQE